MNAQAYYSSSSFWNFDQLMQELKSLCQQN